METAKVTLRGKEYTGQVTDDDAMFFASMYYNESEQKLAEAGKEQEAFIQLSDRLKNAIDTSSDPKKAEQEITGNIALKIRRAIATNFETRKIVCWRLLECFPNLPNDMIYWVNENKFGIRLSMEELITLFMSVIAAAFKVGEELQQQEPTEVKEVASEVILEPIPDTETAVTPRTAEMGERTSQALELCSKDVSSPSSPIASSSVTTEIDRQIEELKLRKAKLLT